MFALTKKNKNHRSHTVSPKLISTQPFPFDLLKNMDFKKKTHTQPNVNAATVEFVSNGLPGYQVTRHRRRQSDDLEAWRLL